MPDDRLLSDEGFVFGSSLVADLSYRFGDSHGLGSVSVGVTDLGEADNPFSIQDESRRISGLVGRIPSQSIGIDHRVIRIHHEVRSHNRTDLWSSVFRAKSGALSPTLGASAALILRVKAIANAAMVI